jgi:5-methylcytosine-specific restriction endonuclease McrA
MSGCPTESARGRGAVVAGAIQGADHNLARGPRPASPCAGPAAPRRPERALTLLVEDLERTKLALAKRPRRSVAPTRVSRHVPAAVKREVWARDEGRCAFVGRAGRCAERGFLELHHLVPFADGGATDAGNLQLRCRAHNAFEAEEWFGPLVTRERPLAYGLGDSS